MQKYHLSAGVCVALLGLCSAGYAQDEVHAEGLAWGPGPVARPAAKIEALKWSSWYTDGVEFAIRSADDVELTPQGGGAAGSAADVEYDEIEQSRATIARIPVRLSDQAKKARERGQTLQVTGTTQGGGNLTGVWHQALEDAIKKAAVQVAQEKRGEGRLRSAKGMAYVNKLVSDENDGDYKLTVEVVIDIR